MSTSTIRVNLSEVKTFRVICKVCNKGVIEVSVDALGTALASGGKCRLCDHHIMARMINPDPLRRLADAIDSVLRLSDVLDVEIEIPAPTTK